MASELPSTNGEMNAIPFLSWCMGEPISLAHSTSSLRSLQQPAGGLSHGTTAATETAITHTCIRSKLIFVTQLVCSMPLLHDGRLPYSDTPRVAPFSHRLPKHNHFASVPLSTSMAFRIEGPVLTYLSINAPTPSTLKSPAGSSIVVDQQPDHANPAPLKNSHVAEHK